VNAKGVRDGMADIDRDALPSVAEARAVQHQRADTMKMLAEANRADDQTLREADNDNVWQDRRDRKDAATDRATEIWEQRADAERARIDPVDIGDIAKDQVLFVVDAASGVADTLCNFVDGLLGGAPPKPEFTTASQMEEIRAQRKALAALENIRESMERGEGLSAADISNLTPTHLANIKLHGDDYLRSIIEAQERSNPLQIDYGRAREA